MRDISQRPQLFALLGTVPRILLCPYVYRRKENAEPLRKIEEFIFDADRGELVRIGRLKPAEIPIHIQRNVRADCREIFRHLRVFRSASDILADLPRYLSRIGHHVLYRSPFRKQLGRLLLSDSLDPWNVVGGVAGKGEIVDHLLRTGKMPVLLDFVDSKNLRRSGAASGTEQLDLLRNELGGILVGSDYVYRIESISLRLHGKRADYVIRLVPFLAQHRNAQRLGHLERIRDVGGKILRHLLTARLVLRV